MKDSSLVERNPVLGADVYEVGKEDKQRSPSVQHCHLQGALRHLKTTKLRLWLFQKKQDMLTQPCPAGWRAVNPELTKGWCICNLDCSREPGGGSPPLSVLNPLPIQHGGEKKSRSICGTDWIEDCCLACSKLNNSDENNKKNFKS